MMNAFLEVAAEQHILRAAVRRYVQSDPDSPERILAFGEMVRAL